MAVRMILGRLLAAKGRHSLAIALSLTLLLWLAYQPVLADSASRSEYLAYGFLFEQDADQEEYGRFTEHEIEVLGSVILAFADLVGGPAALNALVDGPVSVRRDLQSVVSYTQAGQVIGLGRGAFDVSVTRGNNYYTWGAGSGDELAQIVFGHEIGHRWIETLYRQSGTDWGAVYGQNVWRGERASAPDTWAAPANSEDGAADPEEEAVTNLALFALGRGYRWTFLRDAPAGEARQVWVDGWVYDLMRSSAAALATAEASPKERPWGLASPADRDETLPTRSLGIASCPVSQQECQIDANAV
jgi:hypothetical protein